MKYSLEMDFKENVHCFSADKEITECQIERSCQVYIFPIYLSKKMSWNCFKTISSAADFSKIHQPAPLCRTVVHRDCTALIVWQKQRWVEWSAKASHVSSVTSGESVWVWVSECECVCSRQIALETELLPDAAQQLTTKQQKWQQKTRQNVRSDTARHMTAAAAAAGKLWDSRQQERERERYEESKGSMGSAEIKDK